jgi:hypothetical protein
MERLRTGGGCSRRAAGRPDDRKGGQRRDPERGPSFESRRVAGLDGTGDQVGDLAGPSGHRGRDPAVSPDQDGAGVAVTP